VAGAGFLVATLTLPAVTIKLVGAAAGVASVSVPVPFFSSVIAPLSHLRFHVSSELSARTPSVAAAIQGTLHKARQGIVPNCMTIMRALATTGEVALILDVAQMVALAPERHGAGRRASQTLAASASSRSLT